MKKLLSVIVTVAMLISCIAPSLATFAASEPALVIADASFDPAARDAKATTTVSIANNPGFYYGVFYLYYDSTELNIAEGAVANLIGDDYTFEATYECATTTRTIKNALKAAGVTAYDELLCVEIVVEGDENYTGSDFVSAELEVIADVAEGGTLTYGIVPGEVVDENEDEVEFAAGVGTLTAVVDPNTPVYEDKQFDSTTLYADSVTVNKGVTTVEVGFAVEGTGELIEAYGMNTLVFRIVYPKELKLVSTRIGDVFGASENGIDLDSQYNFADPSYTPSKEVQDECAWSGYTWEGSDDYIVTAFFSDDDPYYQNKDRGYLAYATFELPEDAKGTYDIKVISCEENFFASVYETTNDVPEPVYIPYAIDNGSITVNVGECKHEILDKLFVAPTCTTAGLTQYVCADCGEVTYEAMIDATGHVPGDKVIVKAPTVDAEGWYEIKCTVCGEVVEEGAVPAIEAVVFTVGDVTAKFGDTVSLPINVKNNNGMFIATFDVAYDASALTFKGFKAGDVFPADAEVLATEYEAGKVRIYFECADVADATANGLLGNIEFAVADDAALVGTTVEVVASAEADNIINVDGVALEAIFQSGSVAIASREATIAVGKVEAPFGKEVVVPVTVEGNPGMFIAILDVCYDTENLKFIGFNNGDVFDGINVYVVEYEAGKIQLYFEAKENANVTANGVLMNLKFAVADNAELVGSDLAVTLVADDDNMLNYEGKTFDYILEDGAVKVADREKVYVADASAKYGEEVVVDLAIADNPGFFIGIFEVKYDESVMSFDRVVGGMKDAHILFSETEAGVVRVYVEAKANADITVDGVLAALAFNVANDAALVGATSAVEVEIVEVINYAGKDVDLATANGKVTVLDREKIAVGDAVAEFKHEVKVPVTISKNPGFWASVLEFTFDAEAFDFVGAESGLFSVAAGENYSCNGNVVTVFVENDDVNANLTADGDLFYLVFAPKAEDSAMTVEAKIVEMIDVDAKDVAGFAMDTGDVTTVACDHSENELYSVVTKEPTATEEGVTTFYCAYCDAVIKTEAIAKLTAIVVGDAEAEYKHDVAVNVTINQNPGFWAAIVEYTFDAEAFDFVGIESGIFETVAGENYSCNGNVVTVFVENADVNANVTEDGIIYSLVFAPKAENAAMTVEANIVEVINVAGKDVAGINVVGGKVTTVPCDHSEGKLYSVVTKEPTATEEGVTTFYCAICDAVVKTETISKTTAIVIGDANASVGDTVEVPVTLANNKGVWSIGMEFAYASEALSFVGVKGGLFTADEANASAKDGIITVFVDADTLANVTEDGVAFYLVFKACGDGDFVVDGTLVADNTIDVNGKAVSFEVVDGTIVIEGIHEHVATPAVKENVVEATCTTTGSYDEVVYCACGVELSRKTIVTDVVPHTPAIAVAENVVDATCTTPGSYDAVVYCDVCGVELSRETIATEPAPHTEVVDGAFAATCTRPGSTGTVYCSVCNVTIKEAEVIEAPGHVEVVDAAVAATCLTTGLTKGSHCDVCGMTIVAQTVVAKTAHNLVVDAAVEATCLATGLTEGSHCADCGATVVAQTVVAKTAHVEVIDPAVDATCSNVGLTEGSHCDVCGATIVAQTVVPTTDHKAVVDKAVDATCAASGLTEGSHCEICGEVIVAQEEVPALRHENKHVEGYDPTCTEEGLTDGIVCANCGEVLLAQEVMPALGHELGDDIMENNVPASCTEDGYFDKVNYCTVCGEEIYREVFVRPAVGHDFSGDFVVDKEAEIGVAGEQSKHCLNGCGERAEITEIPALPVPVTEYKLTVNGVETVVKAGETVELSTVKAELIGTNCKAFAKWVVVSGGVVVADETSNVTTFVMPEEDVVIESTTYMVGDVDGNGKVNSFDSIKLTNAYKDGDISGLVNTNIDGDANGRVNAFDLIALKTILKGTYEYKNYLG